MPTNVNDKIRKLRPARRNKVEVRAAQLIAEGISRIAVKEGSGN